MFPSKRSSPFLASAYCQIKSKLVHIYVFYAHISIPLASDATSIISTRSFPYLIGGVLTLLGVVLALTSLNLIRKNFRKGDCTSTRPLITAYEAKRAATLGMGLILYSLGMAYVGYIVSSVAFAVFVLFIYKATNKIAFWGVSLISPVILYVVFVYLIEVQMPESFLI